MPKLDGLVADLGCDANFVQDGSRFDGAGIERINELDHE
jgi:hypothetical protein